MLLLCSSMLYAQDKQSYTGVVKDSGGAPLIGVLIFEKSTSNAATTDINGAFTITAKPGSILVITYVGSKPLEVKLGAQKSLDLTLVDDMNQLDELIVVGYGVTKKSDLTSSVASVKAEDLVKTSVTSLDQGLQGRAAGVVVSSTSGQPGASTSIRIRGTSSIMGTNEPLYVIDGVPMIGDGSTSSGMSKGPSLNPLASINPNDVSSIEILKDASATAIYGARGANGVILITTKRGAKGAVKTTLNAYYGIQQVANKLKLLNAEQLALLGNDATDNAGIDRRLIYADLNNLRKKSTDWQNEIFQLAPIQSYEVGFSGGSDKTTYYLSANFFSQDGVVIGSDYKKGSVRFNLDQQISPRVKVGFSSNLSYSLSHGVVTNAESAIPSSITSWALQMNPALPVRNEDGTYVYENNTSNPAVGNPVQDANEYEQLNQAGRVISNAYLQLDLIKGLNLKSSFGIDYFNVKDKSFASGEIKRGESTNGSASIGNTSGYTWVFENTLNYNTKLGQKQNLDAVVGITAQKFAAESVGVATADFSDGRLGYNSIQSGAQRQMSVSNYVASQMLSYLARVNYGYDSRYLLTLTGRIDGSSKFGANNKYGFFPSSAFAWRASEEEFLKANKHLSNLKFRLSYGLVGNEGISPYSSQGLLFSTEAYVGANQIIKGQAPFSLQNRALKWETTAQSNIGFDLGLFNNRLTVTADAYMKKTKDLLLNVPVRYDTGFDIATQNIGDLQNKGYEFSMNAVLFDGKKFQWSSTFNFGQNSNEVTHLAGSNEGLSGEPIMGINYWTKITEGKPIGAIYGYQTAGIVQLGDDLSKVPTFPGQTVTYGDRKYVSQTGSTTLSQNDLVYLGSANPKFTYGFNNTFAYNLGENKGNLNLTIYIQGVSGNKIANFNTFSLESFDGNQNNSTAALERWSIENPSNVYPRANAKPSSYVMSDHQVEDGSYIRLKDVTLSYNLPSLWINKLNLKALQFFVSGNNLVTITSYSGYDPEVSRFGTNNLSMGADYGSYPMSKIYNFGVKATF